MHYVYHCDKFTKIILHFSTNQLRPPLDNTNCNQKLNKRIKVSELWDLIRLSQLLTVKHLKYFKYLVFGKVLHSYFHCSC